MADNFLKKHKEVLSLAILAAIFFVIYLFLYWDIFRAEFNPAAGEPPRLIFNQPDESANYFFIRQVVLENRFSFPEPLSGLALSQVHPRSATVINGGVVPIGFPGFIVLLGGILKILTIIAGTAGFNILAVMITPLVGVITPLFFYGLLRRFFDKRLAWLAAALMFFLPPWWYYASRPFQHNILFVSLFVVLLYCFGIFWERREQKNKIGVALAMGLFFGLAVYVRPSEIVWLTIVLAGFLVLSRRYWQKREVIGLAGALVLTAVLFFATQTAFYGHPLASGYVRPDASGAGGLITSGPQGIPILKAIFLPFGFHPRVIWHNLRGNFFHLFGLWSFLMAVGFIFWTAAYLKSKSSKFQVPSFNLHYLVLFVFVFIYLLIFYGSWLFYDNLDQRFSIGSSHVRYFLPIYVLALPFAASFLLLLWRRSWILKIAAGVLSLALFAAAYLNVFAPFEGLKTVKTTVQNYKIWQERVYSLTETDAIILTSYGDKYLFPGRKVVAGWNTAERKQAVLNLVRAGYPVYYYDFKSADAGFNLGPVLASWADLELRRIDNTFK